MEEIICPEMIVHYYEAGNGPFQNLSDPSLEQAEVILEQIRRAENGFASKRDMENLRIRRFLEERMYCLFIEKGGQPRRLRPHKFILECCDWVKILYCHGREAQILLKTVDPEVISFTYGDSFPAMRYQDGKPYRGQVYALDELPGLIAQYGYPQVWNREGRL